MSLIGSQDVWTGDLVGMGSRFQTEFCNIPEYKNIEQEGSVRSYTQHKVRVYKPGKFCP